MPKTNQHTCPECGGPTQTMGVVSTEKGDFLVPGDLMEKVQKLISEDAKAKSEEPELVDDYQHLAMTILVVLPGLRKRSFLSFGRL